ncbi:cytochrome c oxidase subunit 6b-3-like [Lolium rigidum]|uniref:cytochrome c oxidase subunit 6b-3-like n=1 Tax=Lolium rigidum TaxID=89674 RepID=UPI001F5D7F9A|nr:cytochrome c oxidase subunit 6b-3-like [Lolium rigidum]
MADNVVNPHDKMRSRDVNKVARGEQAPRPPHEPGSVADSPPAPPDGGTIELRTAPSDFRFPTTNQTRHCYVRYLEYHRCMKAKEGDNSECAKFQRYYRSLCPTDWVVEWNRQREEGIFPGPI